MKRSEIWLVNLDPAIGSEIKKKRPAIIVNDDEIGILPLKVIVPVADWKDRYNVAAWMVKIDPDKINSLDKASAADCFQVRSVSEIRLIKKIGSIDHFTMQKITVALSKVLKI